MAEKELKILPAGESMIPDSSFRASRSEIGR
jgi:hypothetical protein